KASTPFIVIFLLSMNQPWEMQGGEKAWCDNFSNSPTVENLKGIRQNLLHTYSLFATGAA
ncbi:hypothetical protein, partial [Chroogloeocystis siderophila]|uniref:hypothetical protein n=1 Tax=Chroogloeocystis siderophila TaxID=329163 RepID=UPI001C4A5959